MWGRSREAPPGSWVPGCGLRAMPVQSHLLLTQCLSVPDAVISTWHTWLARATVRKGAEGRLKSKLSESNINALNLYIEHLFLSITVKTAFRLYWNSLFTCLSPGGQEQLGRRDSTLWVFCFCILLSTELYSAQMLKTFFLNEGLDERGNTQTHLSLSVMLLPEGETSGGRIFSKDTQKQACWKSTHTHTRKIHIFLTHYYA